MYNKKLSVGIAIALTLGIMPAAFAAPQSQQGGQTAQAKGNTVNVDNVTIDKDSAKAFRDLPSDHWAYDAIEQLAKDGIIIGYGDSNFLGERKATRYEVAQIVARAISYGDTANAQDKRLITKLAAEFATELNKLGVRVSTLEKYADKVKITGEARYTAHKYDNVDKSDGIGEIRVTPEAEINKNWSVKARIIAGVTGDHSGSEFTVDRAYAEANYDNLNVQLGKVGFIDNSGLVFDEDYDSFHGGRVTFGNKLKVSAGGGRWNGRNIANGKEVDKGNVADDVTHELSDKADYQFFSAQYKDGKVRAGAAVHHLKSSSLYSPNKSINRATRGGEADIWTANFGYDFNNDLSLDAAYAKNEHTSVGDESKSVKLSYKGADKDKKKSWGVYSAYRNLGANTTFNASDFGLEKMAGAGLKGYQLGGTYTPFKNIVVSASYFDGKNVFEDRPDEDTSSVEGRISFFYR